MRFLFNAFVLMCGDHNTRTALVLKVCADPFLTHFGHQSNSQHALYFNCKFGLERRTLVKSHWLDFLSKLETSPCRCSCMSHGHEHQRGKLSARQARACLDFHSNISKCCLAKIMLFLSLPSSETKRARSPYRAYTCTYPSACGCM